MEDFLLDPLDSPRPAPRASRRAELFERVLDAAAERAREHGIDVVAEPGRRASDLAMLWFQGDRSRVLHGVGGWDPGTGVLLQIAHGGHCAGRYELVVFAVVEATPDRRAA